ncbi:enoyl-CoA hydratase [Alphaproteobacteria bacterium]|nr:enoyl-CoA hydratase [Alphaproteobacteria bacterium]MDC3270718.1 enoyl-CoA hydratase [Alphaproteobacteria bacterium]
MSDVIIEDFKDSILKITLNNPSQQNTLSLQFINDLKKIIENADNSDEVKVIILSSSGKVFSAGHNLKEIKSHRKDKDQGFQFFTTLINSCSDLMLKIINNSKPVIAEVNGIATAAGCQLVASCDLAYASDSSKFATPGVNIGLFCSTPMVALSRVVNNKHSMEMLLTGDLINADKAKSIGLINNYFSEDKLVNETREMAVRIANKSSLTLRIGKKAFYNQTEMKISDAYKYASEIMIKNMMSQDSEEGIEAFLEKREPNWS